MTSAFLRFTHPMCAAPISTMYVTVELTYLVKCFHPETESHPGGLWMSAVWEPEEPEEEQLLIADIPVNGYDRSYMVGPDVFRMPVFNPTDQRNLPAAREFLISRPVVSGCLCKEKDQSGPGKMIRKIPSLRDFKTTCPEALSDPKGGRCFRGEMISLWNLLIHINDDHQWTREAIAYWLEETAEENNLDLSFPIPEDPRDH